MDVDVAIKTVWDFHQLEHDLAPAEVMLVLGSNDLRVANHAANLYHQGLSPLVVCSGGIAHTDDLLNTGWDSPEADVFAQALKTDGVPDKAILIERHAKNTSENFRLSLALLNETRVYPTSAIAVQKPFMERRTWATGRRWWPRIRLSVSSPRISFEDYVSGSIGRDKTINIMVGDLQRIDVYARKGYQIPQTIPGQVREAFDVLVKAGYDKHLVKE